MQAKTLGREQQGPHRRDADHAAVAQIGVDLGVGHGRAAGMVAHGRGALFGTAAHERDHRLLRGDLAGDRAESVPVGDGLDVQQHASTAVLIAEIFEIVGHFQMDGVADRNDGTDGQIVDVGLGDDLLGDCTRLGNCRDAAARRQVAQESGSEGSAFGEVDDARAVGPEDGDTGGIGLEQQLGLTRHAVIAGLAKPAR